MAKKKFMTLLVCLALVLLAIVGIFFLSRHITYQMEANQAMEQQECINQLYRELNLNRPLPSDDPMDAPLVIIGFAGLRSLGFSHEDVEWIWVEGSIHPDFEEIRGFFARSGIGLFADKLNGIYIQNFDALSAQFADLTLNPHSDSSRIPLPVLHEVIRIWKSENPPQPRPVVETESEP